jgi:hypothetical protein
VDRGRVVAEGTPDAVKDELRALSATLISDPPEPAGYY